MSTEATAGLYADEAARCVETLAGDLERLAVSLRRRAEVLRGDSAVAGRTSSIAADAVTEYIQFGGKAGARITDILANAAQADKAYWEWLNR